MRCVTPMRCLRWRPSTIPLLLLLCPFILVASGISSPTESLGSGVAPLGVGSIPGRLFEDGRVCLVDTKDSSRCEKVLFTLPDEIVKKRVSVTTSIEPFKEKENFFKVPDEKVPVINSLTFYGVFDVDNDGDPEVFLDYWDSEDPDCPEKYKLFACLDCPEFSCQAITLLVYKKVGETYQPYLKLQAGSMGYHPGAWFLDESPVRKAIFQTRYHGSAGTGLLYLDFKKPSLELISDKIAVLGFPPIFEDVDKDGVAEIFVQGRGWNRTGTSGAAVLRWKDDIYKIWWPDWTAQRVIQSTIEIRRADGASEEIITSATYPIPYVVYAALVDLDHDQQKEIVAVLDPEVQSPLRELGIWKLIESTWTLVDKIQLPATESIESPTISKISPPPHGAEIDLHYSKEGTVKCLSLRRKLTCTEPKDH